MLPPVFIKPLEGVQYVEPGVTHALDCDVTGLPLPVVTWSLDGDVINEGDFDGSASFNSNKTR